MKLFKNKKGKYFITLVSVFLIISLGAMLYFINKNQDESARKGDVGMKSKLITQTYQEAESSLFYIDMAAGYAAPDAYFLTAYEGGLPFDSPCGNHYNFMIWDFDEEECIPVSENRKPVKDLFEIKMNEEIDNFFRIPESPVTQFNNYKINIFEEEGREKTIVSGDAIVPLSFDMKKYDIETGYTTYTLPPASYPAGPVGKSNKEAISFIINTYGHLVSNYCAPLGVQDSLMVGLITQESRGKKFAISWTGCAGLNQFCLGTAREYSHILGDITPCSCSGSSCTYGTAACNAANDGRFDPEKSIRAGCQLLYDYTSRFDGYTDKVKFGLAAYNGGPDTIRRAIKRTGEQDPSWETVSAHITPGLTRSVGMSGSKAKEIRGYVPAILNFQAEAENQLRGITS